jgi:hypothetical protein
MNSNSKLSVSQVTLGGCFALLLVLSTSAACSSSGSDDSDADPGTGGTGVDDVASGGSSDELQNVGSIVADINGTEHEFVVRYANVLGADDWLVIGADPVTDFPRTITINILPLAGPGTYSCQTTQESSIVFTDGPSDISTTLTVPCEIIVEEWGGPGEPVRGTFAGATYRETYVFDGRFDVIRGD